MARHKDINWNLPEGIPSPTGNIHAWESINVAVLMDIRDELKRLNSLLDCANFIDMPRKLDGIAKNTAKPKLKKGT